MLSTDNPAAGNVLTGQATADLAHFTFTGSGTISALTLQRTGLSTSSGLANVYLYNGTTRLTDAAAVNTNGTITFGGLNLVVNGSMTISVRADIYSASTDVTVGVNLTSYTVNGTTVTTNLAGNLMYVSSGTGLLAGVQLGATNSVVSATVNAGSSQYTLWSDSLNVSTHAVQLKAARFTFIGSAPTNAVANLKLYVDGSPVATSAGIMSDQSGTYVAFDLTGTNSMGTTCGVGAGFCLTTGSHTVDVRGDIVAGSARTILLSLMNQADLMVTDSQTGGVNVGVTTSPSTTNFSPASAGTITINGANGGTVTATIDPTFSSATNITGGSTNATIAKYTLTAYGENEKIMQVIVTPTIATGTPTATTIQNVTLYYNGAQIGTSQLATSGSPVTFNLGSSLIVTAGTTGSLEVHADLQNGSGNYTAGTLTVSGNIPAGEAQGTSSLQTNTSMVSLPTTNGLSIQTGLLAIAKNPSYTNQSISPNTAGAKIGSFIIQNQSSSDSVRVTNLQIPVLFGAGAGSTNISNLRTSETSGSGSTPINPATAAASSTSINNFPVNFTLAPSATKVIDIFADLSTASGPTVTMTTSLQLTALSTGANTTICSGSLTGGSVNGCNTGTAATGQMITANTGTFAAPVLVSSSSTQAQYIAVGTTSGATNASLATFNFTSAGGTANINELKFTVTASTGTPVGSVTVSDASGSHTAYVIGGVADITGLNIAVPNGAGGINVGVYASYGAAGSTGTTSGATATLALSYVKFQSGTSTVTSCASGCTLTNANVSAPTITVVASVPSLTVVQPNVSLSVGNVEAIDVTITANAAGNITLNTLPLTLSATNAVFATTTSSTIVKDQNGNTITTTSTAIGAGTGGTPVITFTGGYLMTAGSTQTFKVYVPVTSISGSGVNSASIYTSVAPSSSFTWTDTAGNGASGAQTGQLINNFPTNNSVVHN